MRYILNTPVNLLSNCWTKSEPINSESNQSDFFMVNRFMSFYPRPRLLKRTADISRLQKELPSWAVGCLLYHTTPKMSQPPIGKKYISIKEEEVSPEISAICKIFCVGKKHAKQIAYILKQENISLGEKGRK